MRPAEQANEDDIIIAQQEKDRRAQADRATDFRSVTEDLRMNDGLGQTLKPERKSPGEQSLAELSEKAKRAPRDG